MWPEVIVRKDRHGQSVRFVRISDKKFLRGDPRAEGPGAVEPAENDEENHPLTPHLVKVSAFYIQETEVTNGEIEDYLAGPGRARVDNFKSWNENFELLKRSLNPDNMDSEKALAAARRFPAVNISYQSAWQYAKDMGGRLPTEAEWELAAKSEIDNRCFVWDMKSAKPGASPEPGGFQPKAHLLYRRAARTDYLPREVKCYPATDKTMQNVFDMAGNVREWCLDAYRPYDEILKGEGGAKKPILDDPDAVAKAPNSSQDAEYVVRGGSFFTEAARATTFVRGGEAPDLETGDLGFRIVISCPRLKPLP
jgi:serine/threonine-protein kinase